MTELILLFGGGWILFFVRLVLGFVVIYYSWPRVTDIFRETKNNSADARALFSPDTMLSIINLVAGVLVVFGALTQIATLVLFIEYLGFIAWRVFKEKSPFSDWSHDVLLLSLALIILTFGPGFYGVESFL